MFIGGFLALLQRNIKRILAYSSMSQAGYILLGVGLTGILKDHKAVAIYATFYHIINHAIFKVLLFMGAGIIYMILHELSINVIRGFGKNKPLLKVVFFIGLLAIIGMPGFNGFISKTLLHEALLEANNIDYSMWLSIGEIVFTISSGFTVAYLLKIFIAVFMEKNEKYTGQFKSHVRKRAIFPMGVLGAAIVYIGLNPDILMPILEKSLEVFDAHGTVESHFYTNHNIQTSIITILIGIFIYLGFVQLYLRKHTDKEYFYINPSIKWLNLERDVYEPIIRITFVSVSEIFHFIDRILVDSVYLLRAGIKALSGMKIRHERYRKKGTKNSIDVKHFIDDISSEFHSLSDVLRKLYKHTTSLMSAIFIVAIILAIVLLVLVF
ncbi:hypothetical protein FQB35_14735 [Crassaminicella thermophila]|uniref:NADH:quinone oxidoreductase/Mrp antiporter transmembrane domain-containing protein n=1 Tax=Crassaminicella thermophila TaxID=2599308 RepID=A0A5C0SIB2_CRATE|nr:proton-conducting transporter membrane subunit [Crassaminicella thermophila]QEK13417.1 hypothetical protein FQB35_14735 [Crassaminicella thermophila]